MYILHGTEVPDSEGGRVRRILICSWKNPGMKPGFFPRLVPEALTQGLVCVHTPRDSPFSLGKDLALGCNAKAEEREEKGFPINDYIQGKS